MRGVKTVTQGMNQVIDWVNRLVPMVCLGFMGWVALEVHASSVDNAVQDTKLASLSEFVKSQKEINNQVIVLTREIAVIQDRSARDKD